MIGSACQGMPDFRMAFVIASFDRGAVLSLGMDIVMGALALPDKAREAAGGQCSLDPFR